MALRVDHSLAEEIARFGGFKSHECFNCGNCTAVCELAEEPAVFPRRAIRRIQVGDRTFVRHSLEPWLCYYCGDCSRTCPRQADPGELMMAARRFLTAEYDWTGLSRRLFLSKGWQIAVSLIAAGVVVLFFALSGAFSAERMVTERVSMNTFIPAHWVHTADMVLAGVLGGLLLINAGRMYRFAMRSVKGVAIPFFLYLLELKTFVLHFFTQLRWRTCESRIRWIKHLSLVAAYLTMAILVEIFLVTFQRNTSAFHFTSIFGYIATVILLYYCVDALIGRLRRKEELYKYSQPMDWLFLLQLLLTSLTGLAVNVFRTLDLPMAAYIGYVVHLCVAVSMLVVQVPFGKWSHLLYRPLAIYLNGVRERALQLAESRAPSATRAA